MSARSSSRSELALVAATVALALGLWYLVFVSPIPGFWRKMSFSVLLLAMLSLWRLGDRVRLVFSTRARHLLIGFGSAVVLYGVFVVGKVVLESLSPAAHGSIAAVYGAGAQAPRWAVGLLLLLVTSPAEEVYWRGFVQRVLAERLGPRGGFAVATLCYAGVHVVTLNLPLVLAAATAGAAWGWIYLREGSLVPSIISHSVWAVLIFVVFPVA
jgi:membrane protease YdiL (CAAX protease family)